MPESGLRVGIFFNARPEQAGLYHYALTLLDCLRRFAPEHTYVLYVATLAPLPVSIAEGNWRTVHLPRNGIRLRLAIEYLLMLAARNGLRIATPVMPEFAEIRRDRLDLMLYVKPTPHVFLWKYAAIFPIHDLQHRFQPEFPEVSEKGEYRRREYLYTNATRTARAILADSEVGKEDVIACYGAEQNKVIPLPYIAPASRSGSAGRSSWSELREKYKLPEGYLFYPAAFWAHKNHFRLVTALGAVAKDHGIHIPLVLAGGLAREYPKIVARVDELGLHDAVHFIGYVPDEELAALYQNALALVMPTFFGPTNIPILEAWANGCPVITSDLRGIREQVGDAGLLVDPRSEAALGNAIWEIYSDAELREQLAERGRRRVALWTPEMFAQRLSDAIKFAARRTGSIKS